MGELFIVATPIGNLEDITIRAIKTLFSVDYIACEDTRRTGQLLSTLYKTYNSYNTYNKKPQLISYYDEIEFQKTPQIINLLQGGKNIALVSDSGTPLISDPGFKLVQECFKKTIKVTSIPGASSVTTALVASGLSTDNFLFLGFLPAKEAKRNKILNNLFLLLKNSNLRPTIVFFEAPHRIKETLQNLNNLFGNIEVVIARELTKIYEEIQKGKILDLIRIKKNFKGEMVVLFKP